jgi:hypothetical protein
LVVGAWLYNCTGLFRLSNACQEARPLTADLYGFVRCSHFHKLPGGLRQGVALQVGVAVEMLLGCILNIVVLYSGGELQPSAAVMAIFNLMLLHWVVRPTHYTMECGQTNTSVAQDSYSLSVIWWHLRAPDVSTSPTADFQQHVLRVPQLLLLVRHCCCADTKHKRAGYWAPIVATVMLVGQHAARQQFQHITGL